MAAEVDDRTQSMPLVEDVIDDQHVTVDKGNFRLGLPEQLTATGLIAIARGVQVGQLQGEVEPGQQLAGKDQAAIHHAEHHRVTLSQISIDPTRDSFDGCFNLGFGMQAISFSHDLADMCKIDGHSDAPER